MKLLLMLFLASVTSIASATEIDPGVASQYNTRLQEMLDTTGWDFPKAMDTKQISSEWQLNQARAQIKFSKPGIYHGKISKVVTDNFGVNLIIDQGKSTAVTVILENNQVSPWNMDGGQLRIGGIQSSLEFAANLHAGQELYFQCRRVQFGIGVYLSNCLAFPPSVAKAKAGPEVATNMDANISVEELIRARAAESWSRPASARKSMHVTLKIGMQLDGTITSVNVVNSSGDTPFDNSAVAAVLNIGVLAEVQTLEPSEVSRYRLFKMAFTPDDLNL
jgi:colicin import membrane protein